MSDNEIQVYLSGALDQEACRETLLAALQSRVSTLQELCVSDTTLISCLECLYEDPYQINDDIIFEVIELITISSVQTKNR